MMNQRFNYSSKVAKSLYIPTFIKMLLIPIAAVVGSMIVFVGIGLVLRFFNVRDNDSVLMFFGIVGGLIIMGSVLTIFFAPCYLFGKLLPSRTSYIATDKVYLQYYYIKGSRGGVSKYLCDIRSVTSIRESREYIILTGNIVQNYVGNMSGCCGSLDHIKIPKVFENLDMLRDLLKSKIQYSVVQR